MTAEEVNAKVEGGRKAAVNPVPALPESPLRRCWKVSMPEQLISSSLIGHAGFTENGETFTAPYTAVSYGKIVLFTHLV